MPEYTYSFKQGLVWDNIREDRNPKNFPNVMKYITWEDVERNNLVGLPIRYNHTQKELGVITKCWTFSNKWFISANLNKEGFDMVNHSFAKSNPIGLSLGFMSEQMAAKYPDRCKETIDVFECSITEFPYFDTCRVQHLYNNNNDKVKNNYFYSAAIQIEMSSEGIGTPLPQKPVETPVGGNPAPQQPSLQQPVSKIDVPVKSFDELLEIAKKEGKEKELFGVMQNQFDNYKNLEGQYSELKKKSSELEKKHNERLKKFRDGQYARFTEHKDLIDEYDDKYYKERIDSLNDEELPRDLLSIIKGAERRKGELEKPKVPEPMKEDKPNPSKRPLDKPNNPPSKTTTGESDSFQMFLDMYNPQPRKQMVHTYSSTKVTGFSGKETIYLEVLNECYKNNQNPLEYSKTHLEKEYQQLDKNKY